MNENRNTRSLSLWNFFATSALSYFTAKDAEFPIAIGTQSTRSSVNLRVLHVSVVKIFYHGEHRANSEMHEEVSIQGVVLFVLRCVLRDHLRNSEIIFALPACRQAGLPEFSLRTLRLSF